MTKTLTAVTSAACWQAYVAPTAALETSGFSALGINAILPMPVMAAFTAAPFALFAASTTATAGHVQAVAGVEKTNTAPKQADKSSVTRNDVNPDRLRLGAPPS